jgi:hypothetical protein
MKELYLRLCDLLGNVTELKWIDKDKGQLDYYETRPALNFPAALIAFNSTINDTLKTGVYRLKATITVRVAFAYVGEMAALTPSQIRNQSLQYYDTTELISDAIADEPSTNGYRFQLQSITEESRQDGLTVVRLQFTTFYLREKNS